MSLAGLSEDLVAQVLSQLLTDLCDTYSVERPALVVNENPSPGRRHTVKGLRQRVSGATLGQFVAKQPGTSRHTIIITGFKRARETLVHEFAHYLVQLRLGFVSRREAHGPVFVEQFRELCGLYGIEPEWCCQRGL